MCTRSLTHDNPLRIWDVQLAWCQYLEKKEEGFEITYNYYTDKKTVFKLVVHVGVSVKLTFEVGSCLTMVTKCFKESFADYSQLSLNGHFFKKDVHVHLALVLPVFSHFTAIKLPIRQTPL